MTEIEEKRSGSDTSVDSWTLLDENLLPEEQNSDSSEKFKVAETKPESENEEAKNDSGFLTFDEFLQERMLEHDYEHQEKPQKMRKLYKEKLRRGFKKCKAQSLGISVFIVIILGLSAFATLCSSFSQPVEIKVARTNRPVRFDNVRKIEAKNETIKQPEAAIKTNLKPVKPNVTITTKETKLKPVPSVENLIPPKPKPLEKPKPLIQHRKCNTTTIKDDKTKTKTKWMALKEFLLDTNVHALVSLIMTNIYLFTLLTDFAKKPQRKCRYLLSPRFLQDLEKSKNVEELRKYLFKELPYWNAEFVPKNEAKSTSSVAVLTDKKNAVLKPCPFFSETAFQLAETGKSECQRRFEELDQHQKKFDNLKQIQRNRIKLLKQKFRNEVSYIKDTEEEPEARAQKINRTSQMFIRKLKSNREKYLLELKKVRELRQKIAAKKQDSSKDVGVGSYSVSLPTIYDYGERFKMIKEKFQRESNDVTKELKIQ